MRRARSLLFAVAILASDLTSSWAAGTSGSFDADDAPTSPKQTSPSAKPSEPNTPLYTRPKATREETQNFVIEKFASGTSIQKIWYGSCSARYFDPSALIIDDSTISFRWRRVADSGARSGASRCIDSDRYFTYYFDLRDVQIQHGMMPTKVHGYMEFDGGKDGNGVYPTAIMFMCFGDTNCIRGQNDERRSRLWLPPLESDELVIRLVQALRHLRDLSPAKKPDPF